MAIIISPSSVSIIGGQSQGFSVSNLPANVYDYSWSTSSGLGISSSSMYSVTYQKINDTYSNITDTIYYRAYDSNGVQIGSASASITITGRKYVSSISLSPSSLSFTSANQTTTLTASILPSDAYNKTVYWNSSNPSVATVSQSGIVTSVGNGTCTITCTAQDGSNAIGSCSATCNIPILVTGLTLNPTSMSFTTTSTQTITPSLTPTNATNKTLSWSSSNTNVATVSDGVVTPISNGSCTITAITTDGSNKSATCSITVNLPIQNISVTGVSLNTNSLTMLVGNQYLLTATISPSNATNKNVTWNCNNSAIASVSGGTITANGVGSCTITVTTQDGGFTATCSVTVSSSGGGGGTRPSNWAWSYNITSGQPVYRTEVKNGVIVAYIMLATEWMSFVNRINAFRVYKGLQNSVFTSVVTDTNCNPTIINEAVNSINGMGFSIPTVSSGNIPASVFTDMRDRLNSIL